MWLSEFGLQQRLQHPDDIFLPENYEVVRSMASNPITTITLEDNFARASGMSKYMRGNTHAATTMASKHVLSESQVQHRCCLQRLVSRNVGSDVPADSLHSIHFVFPSAKEKASEARLNGWHECVGDQYVQAVRDPSAETLVEYHKRVMQQAAAK